MVLNIQTAIGTINAGVQILAYRPPSPRTGPEVGLKYPISQMGTGTPRHSNRGLANMAVLWFELGSGCFSAGFYVAVPTAESLDQASSAHSWGWNG